MGAVARTGNKPRRTGCTPVRNVVRYLYYEPRSNAMANKPSIQNRGTAEVPFGFVYLDDTRVGFSQVDGQLKVWEARGYPITRQQLRRAANALLLSGLAAEVDQ